MTQALVSNAKWQVAAFKISFAITVEFRAHGTMGRSYEWRLRDRNANLHALKPNNFHGQNTTLFDLSFLTCQMIIWTISLLLPI